MDSFPTIRIFSFGYHFSGIPPDDTGHGGGFVFDCRALPNPGTRPELMRKTGQDPEVQAFLEADPAVTEFLQHAFALISLSARKYRDRQFTDLMVSFGCTGGQHRSVYCAEVTSRRLREAGYDVILKHIDKPDFSC